MGAGDKGPERQETASNSQGSSSAAPDPDSQDRSHAIAEVCRNHHASLVRFVALRTGSIEDAKEIVQEAYAKVLALDRPDTISVLGGYLWRTAVNLAMDRKRERVHQARFHRVSEEAERKWEFSAETTVESRQRLAIVERAIGELPPRCLEAFVLHVLNGLTFEQVGREMGISVRMGKKHLARALEYLHSSLEAADTTRRGL